MEIENMKIKNWDIKLTEYDNLEFTMELQGNGSGTIVSLNMNKLKELFKCLDIEDLKELNNAYCRAVFETRLLKKIINIIDDKKILEV